MKKGAELGCTPIKTRNKEGTYELRDLHCRINDVMYFYNKKDMSGERAEEAYETLCEAGTELKDLEVCDRARAKKEEILGALRAVCKTLKNYADNFKWSKDMSGICKNAVRFETAMLTKAKDGGKFEEDPIKYLEELAELKRTMIDPYDRLFARGGYQNIYTYNIEDFNSEILDMIKRKYRW